MEGIIYYCPAITCRTCCRSDESKHPDTLSVDESAKWLGVQQIQLESHSDTSLLDTHR